MGRNPYHVILAAERLFLQGKRGWLGKVVKSLEDGEIVLRFSGAKVMRATGSLAVNPESLAYLIGAVGVRVEFKLDDGQWLWTTPEEILDRGFMRSFKVGWPPRLNLPLEYWRKMDPPGFVHVPDGPGFVIVLGPVDPREMLKGRSARRPRQRGERIREHETAEQLSLL